MLWSWLGHHLLSKEWTRSIILKYIELRIIALFSCRERETRVWVHCTQFSQHSVPHYTHNPCWWHIESIKKCFYILCVYVILWGSDFSANHFMQCGRVDAFLMQFYAKIHLEPNKSCGFLPRRHFAVKISLNHFIATDSKSQHFVSVHTNNLFAIKSMETFWYFVILHLLMLNLSSQ